MNYAENNSLAHHSTVELANCKLRLRADLAFHLQEYQGHACYLIEDEINSRFYRVGLAEYHLISLLDDSNTLSQAVSQSAAEMGDQGISEPDAITICKWLIDSGLATTDASRSVGRMLETFEKSDRKKQLAKFNPITPKFPLFNPDAFLTQLTGMVGWLFSFPMFFVWCGVVGVAAFQVLTNWNQVVDHQTMFLARDNWIWLGLTWMLLKLVHEIAHGLACKRFGGDVRQCGVVLIVMIPLPFVDVTSSWRFPSKWQRIYVAAAGMYVEIFLAAIAAIVWSFSESGIVKQQALNFVVAGSLTTILFNANPLMRFDGYYMFSDWLEMPNLGTHGQQWMKWVGRRFYLGLEGDQPTWPEGRGGIVATYAILSLVWKVLIYAGLAIAAEALFYGLGIALAIASMGLWVVKPLVKLLSSVFIGEETRQRPSRIRFCLLTAAIGLAGWVFLTQVPWYARVKSPAIVDFQSSHEVRTPVAGFLKKIFVESGESVIKGQLLAQLNNREVDVDVDQLRIELAINELRMRQLRDSAEMAALDVELKNREAIEERLTVRLNEQVQLLVRASADGIVVAEDLNSQLGVFVAPGHKICTIESDGKKEIHAMIGQRDVDLFQDLIGQQVDVHVWGNGTGHFPAKLVHVNPRGQFELLHPALGATAGGPLLVKYGAQSNENAQPENSVQLVAPRFVARLELSQADSNWLRSGQTAFISYRMSRGTVGEVLNQKVCDWIRKMRKLTRSQTL